MMLVPRDQRGKGAGRRFYNAWETRLPEAVRLVRIMAADTGTGPSDGFWKAMGFEYTYDGDPDAMDYETRQHMWKGVNGHSTPPPISVEENDSEPVTQMPAARPRTPRP